MSKSEEVKYDPNNSSRNKILCMALLKAWGNRCYFCERMIASDAEAQIDHIIPQSIYRNGVKFDEIKEKLEGGDYLIPCDVNSVDNLAPVHASCNIEKGDFVPLSLKYRKVLEKAKNFSSKIVKDVKTVRSLKKIRDVLIGADTLDYDNPTVQEDILYYFSVLEGAIKENHPDAADIFSATLDMSIYDDADSCSMPLVPSVLQDRKFQLDYASCRTFLSLLNYYDLSIGTFIHDLEFSLKEALMDDISGLIISECIEREISSSAPVIDPEFKFGLLLNSIRSVLGYFEIEGSLSGSGVTTVIVPDYPSDDDGYERQAEFWFEYNFEFSTPALNDGSFSRKLPSLSDIDSNVSCSSFDFDC